MLPLKTILFLILYAAGLVGSVAYHPLLGVIGYAVTYDIAPQTQWWGAPLAGIGMRLSLFMAIAIFVGMFLHRDKLQYRYFFHSQEKLLILMVLCMWVSIPLGLPGHGGENLAYKITKVAIFLLMFSHIVTDLRKYEIILWTLVIAGFYLAIEAYSAPTGAFGRIDRGVGGSDFAEGNFLGAHLAMLLPFLGVLFLKGGIKSRAFCLIAGVLIVNAIILCRSRGVFLATGAGVIATVMYVPRHMRAKVSVLLIAGMIGALFLTDPGFWARMGRINPDIEDLQAQDSSAEGRLLAWQAALSMAADHPLGIGQNNFQRYVGYYNPTIPGKDTHNTYLRCLAELGFQGLFILLLMIFNCFKILKRVSKNAEVSGNEKLFKLYVFATKIALIIFLVSGMFITHTYIEELYWLLLFPVLLERSLENEELMERVSDTEARDLVSLEGVM